jgi:uncharacterized membrane protein
MTESARQALVGLRDVTTLQWYVVPLLALLFYVYVVEIRDARRTGNWDPVIAGVTLFGADFVNESINGWIFSISGYSALWLAPGPTALRTLVGWNVEIMFMFAIAGILYYKSIDEDPRATILGLPNRWFWALFYSAVSVLVEIGLNKGGLLVWDYRWWNRGVVELLPIFVFGYLWFYLAAKYAIERKTLKAKVLVPVTLFAVAVTLNVVGLGLLGWTY